MSQTQLFHKFGTRALSIWYKILFSKIRRARTSVNRDGKLKNQHFELSLETIKSCFIASYDYVVEHTDLLEHPTREFVLNVRRAAEEKLRGVEQSELLDNHCHRLSYLSRNKRQFYTEVTADVPEEQFCRPCQLNGRNGEATNSDDVKGGMKTVTRKRKNTEKKIADLEKQLHSLRLHGERKVKKIRKRVKKIGGILSPVADKAISLILDPNDRTKAIVGLPRFPVSNSYKVRGWLDVTITTGTNGFGFLAINPALVNNVNCICYSNSAATYTGTSVPATNAGTAGTTAVGFANLPFTSAQLAAQTLQGRIVACGFSVTSTTATLYEQGVLQVYFDPNHADLTGSTPALISSRGEALTTMVKKGDEHHYAYTLINETEMTYQAVSYPLNNTAGVSNAIIMLSGAAGANPVSALVKLNIICEFNGTTAENTATPNGIGPPDAIHHIMMACQRLHDHKISHPEKIFTPRQIDKLGKEFLKMLQHGLHTAEGKAAQQNVEAAGINTADFA
jgi:hypothetical protein